MSFLYFKTLEVFRLFNSSNDYTETLKRGIKQFKYFILFYSVVIDVLKKHQSDKYDDNILAKCF